MPGGGEHKVTDHAVLRWLECVHGVNVEAVRSHLSVRGIDTAAAIGCDTVILPDRSRLRLGRDGLLTVPIAVTCLPKRDQRGRRP